MFFFSSFLLGSLRTNLMLRCSSLTATKFSLFIIPLLRVHCLTCACCESFDSFFWFSLSSILVTVLLRNKHDHWRLFFSLSDFLAKIRSIYHLFFFFLSYHFLVSSEGQTERNDKVLSFCFVMKEKKHKPSIRQIAYF